MAGGLMQIEERVVGDIVVLTVTGEITLNRGGDVVLRDKVRTPVHHGKHRVLNDLAHVSSMDSAGLGQLVQSYVTSKTAGGSLKLVHLTKRLKDLLTITKLVTVFE